MPFSFKTITLLIAMAVLCHSAASQDRHFQFTQFNMENGLANNSVTDILQDKKGFLWFATGNGLQRFDGMRFTTWRFQLNNPRSLPSDMVEQLLEDHEQNLWVACNGGVARINKYRHRPERVVVETVDARQTFQSLKLLQDSRKNIWLITRPGGVYWYDSDKERFIPAGTKWTFSNWKFSFLAEDPRTGNFWAGGDEGLSYIDMGRKHVYYHLDNPLKIPALENPKLYKTGVTGLIYDKKDTLWINTFTSDYPRSTKSYYQSFYYKISSGQLVPYEPPKTTQHQYALDSRNRLWLLGEDVFSLRVADQFESIPVNRSDAFGLKATVVHTFLEDVHHNLWIGTNEGVFAFNPSENKMGRNTAFDDDKTQVEFTPMQFLERPGNKIWMATWGGGIMEYDSSFNPIRRYTFGNKGEDGNYNMIWAMMQGRDGRVWMGCQAGKIIVYNPKSGKFNKMDPQQFDFKTVRTVAEDDEGNIWFGTQQGLIVNYNLASEIFTRYTHPAYPQKEVFGNINKLLRGDRNELWACTDGGGLLKIDTRNGTIRKTYKHNESDAGSIASNTVNDILRFNDSLYVIASAMGVDFFNINTEKFSHLTTMDGLPSNTVFTLEKDKLENIWAGMNGFLVKISMPLKNVEVLSKKHGVFNETFQLNAMQLLRDGRIVAGTTNDFIYFNPAYFRSYSTPPDIHITGFKVFNEDINFDSILLHRKRVVLSFNQNFLRIEYSPLGFLNENLTYYYKLEGLDKDWIRGNADLSANYANLGPGYYTFLVKCQTSDGLSSKNITSIPIYIRPPFWQSLWFLALLALAVAWVIYYLHRVRVNKLLDMEKVRSRIARDLHDDMGSTLSTINILSEMAKMKIEKDLPATKSYINKISDNSSRMMEAMDDIVWSINPMNDNMQKIIARMREYATNLLEAKEIEYSFQADEAVKHVKLDMEARRDFFLIFKEAVNNLAKYSQCTYANIKIEVYEYTLMMKIQDNGRGFVVKEADSGNGLTNMQKRAQSLNSKIHIESSPGLGTKILLEVNFA